MLITMRSCPRKRASITTASGIWVPSISAFTRVFRRAMRGDDAWRCRRAVEFVDRSRGAVKKGSGDAGRYSRSFGLSASIASPPCGEWKAYRVTAAIARNSNGLSLGVPVGCGGVRRVVHQFEFLAAAVAAAAAAASAAVRHVSPGPHSPRQSEATYALNLGRSFGRRQCGPLRHARANALDR